MTLTGTNIFFDQASAAFEKQKAMLGMSKNTQASGKAKEAAQDFEAFFLSRMMETMFEGISTDGMFGGGHAEKIYRSMLINEYGKAMAKTGTVGVADYVMKSILDMQEAFSQGNIPTSGKEV